MLQFTYYGDLLLAFLHPEFNYTKTFTLMRKKKTDRKTDSANYLNYKLLFYFQSNLMRGFPINTISYKLDMIMILWLTSDLFACSKMYILIKEENELLRKKKPFNLKKYLWCWPEKNVSSPRRFVFKCWPWKCDKNYRKYTCYIIFRETVCFAI